MKLRPPPHVCGPVSVQGRLVELEADGSLDATEADAARLLAHGFAPVEDSSADRAEPEARDDDVAAMSRFELFAFLRARGVSAPITIRNDDLRALARAVRGEAVAT